MAVQNPPVVLPIVNGDTGVWGSKLNKAIETLETYINTNLDTNATQQTAIDDVTGDVNSIINNYIPGKIAVSTSTTRPTPVTGLIGLETDTGYLYYCANISGTPTRVPLPGQYVAKIKQTATQTYTSPNGAALILGAADFDRLSGYTSGTRYTAKVPGIYEFTGAITYGANATGYRVAMWYVGGSAAEAATVQMPAVAAVSTTVNARPFIVNLAMNNYVELWGAQNSGANISTDTSLGVRSGIQVKYLGYYGS